VDPATLSGAALDAFRAPSRTQVVVRTYIGLAICAAAARDGRLVVAQEFGRGAGRGGPPILRAFNLLTPGRALHSARCVFLVCGR